MRQHSSARVVPTAFALLTAAGLAMACSSSTGPASVAGTYVLSTIDGQPLPWTLVASQSDTTFLTQGSVTLTASSYVVALDIDAQISGQPHAGILADTGAFSLKGDTLTLASSATNPNLQLAGTALTVSGTTLTVANLMLVSGSSSRTLVFIRQ